MVIGMLIAGLAFAVAGIVEIQVQKSEETLKEGESKLVIHNAAREELFFNITNIESFNLPNEKVIMTCCLFFILGSTRRREVVPEN